ncbi:protein NDNF-like protein [Dinothrombium tinctorium]|uniref:Protein NDNF n=1 Tax=Dinothrombium tinctorium TaxID=1965070 RepID=A0A3S3NV38_9ACAR|nr:protein NDNF-like protein [Dinothrombium tinctorium]RWS09760.1 protein NDNF-like protein [Dinothrombium tinctorium]
MRKSRKERKRRRRHKGLKNGLRAIFLTKYSGSERRIYSDELRSFPGIYVLEISSKGSDAIVNVFFSEFYPYPLLPAASDILVTKSATNEIEIKWNASPSEAIIPIDYIVIVSKQRNIVSYCEILERDLKFGDANDHRVNDPLGMTSTSFNHWWGTTVKRLLAESRKLAQSRLKFEFWVQRSRNNTWHSVKNLNSSTLYFVDVIAINRISNATTVYKGISVSTAARVNSSQIKIKDNSWTKIHLTRENNFTRALKYNFDAKAVGNDHSLWIFVQSCSGLGSFKLSWRLSVKEDYFVEEVFDFKTIQILVNDSRSENKNFARKLQLQLHSEFESERIVNILINKKYTKYPFPRMPIDRSLKVFDTLTTHDTMHLAWTASEDEKVRYCILEKEIAPGTDIEAVLDSFLTMQNSCQTSASIDSRSGNQSGFKKVLCRRYHKYSKRRFNNIIMQKVKNLKAATKYVFIVQISKMKGKALFLEPILVSTKSKLQS